MRSIPPHTKNDFLIDPFTDRTSSTIVITPPGRPPAARANQAWIAWFLTGRCPCPTCKTSPATSFNNTPGTTRVPLPPAWRDADAYAAAAASFPAPGRQSSCCCSCQHLACACPVNGTRKNAYHSIRTRGFRPQASFGWPRGHNDILPFAVQTAPQLLAFNVQHDGGENRTRRPPTISYSSFTAGNIRTAAKIGSALCESKAGKKAIVPTWMDGWKETCCSQRHGMCGTLRVASSWRRDS